MKRLYPFLLMLLLVAASAFANDAPGFVDGWREALPGWVYKFPRDHGVHPEFKTEWWYFTGSLNAAGGKEFGYEVTWFRQGVNPHLGAGLSRFVVPDFKFAHFAISDVPAGRFDFSEKIARGAFGEAGFGNGDAGPLAWIDNWRLSVLPDGRWHIDAVQDGRALTLDLAPMKPPVIEGEQGVSRKAEGEGHASCYYSFTRMRTSGTLALPGAPPMPVTGETWFDHEWATNQLAANQAGWDWFSVQLEDGTELMLYRMRLKDGAADPASSGTYTRKDGSVVYLKAGDFVLEPDAWWKSGATGANYPIGWRVRISRIDVDLKISTPLENQELALSSLAYWEGLIHVTGTAAGAPVTGHGYLELTGYSAPLSMDH
jgi:predicted secreted hydrolase